MFSGGRHESGAAILTFSVATMAVTGRRPLPLAVFLLYAVVTVVSGQSVWQDPSPTFQQQQQQQQQHQNSRACYQTVQNPFAYFGSKTNYGAVAGQDLHTPSDCRPMQVWLVSRHGTRSPSWEKIEQLKKLNVFKTMITAESTLCAEDIAAIRNWNFNLTKNDHNMLQKQGVEELKSLAVRLKRQFPQVFNTPYNDAKFKFLTSGKQRAKDSATVFYQSLFNENPKRDLPVVQPSDDRLQLEKCKHVIVDDDDDDDDDNAAAAAAATAGNANGQGEVKKFVDGPFVRSVVSRVSMAMGLKQNLSYENVTLMLDSCKYEKAWYVHSRPAWCAVFTTADFEVLEYVEDLKYYYRRGYGNSISERMGCPIVKDLINNFKNLARDKTRPLGVFYFGHSTNIMSVVTRLGIGKDDIPLLSTNFELMSHRKWRVSFIDPFASNVIAVFYRCRDGNKAMILLNEHAIPFGKDKCRLCPWEPIETQFDPIISNNKTCNLDMCKNSGTFQSMNLLIVVFVFTCSTLVKHIYF